MSNYKLSGDGVKLNGGHIPANEDNADWQKYLKWLDEGNTPDPEFTPEELDALLRANEIDGLKADLRAALVWQFRMISAIWEIGKSKGLWSNTDVVDATLKQKYAAWNTKLDRLAELGE